MNIYEMEGFLRGKCMPRDILVNESTAAYLVRKLNEATVVKAERDALERQLSMSEAKCKGYFSDAAAALVRCDALTVENVALKKEEVYPSCEQWWQIETPATSAAIAAIEARGVEKAIELLLSKFSGTGHIGVPAMALESLATELREAK